MILLNSQVTSIPMIGPKYKKLLEKLDIYTVEDLLYHFPFRYDDFSIIKNIADLQEGEIVTVEATLESIDNIFTKYGKRLTKAKISDQTGAISVVWFNQHYIKQALTPLKKYKFSGKIQSLAGKLGFVSPEIEDAEKASLNTSRLVPIYPETAGVSSKYLRTRINDVLHVIKKVEEFLPAITLINHKLVDLDTALRAIHFPNNLIEKNHAEKRLAFEELFLELLKVEDRKTKWEQKLVGTPLEVSKHKKEIEKLIAGLPFTLTNTQEKAVEEIFADLTQKHPMNRLLEGDVGTGKTIVAIIASYLTYLNGLNVLYMAPTEILANQHFATFNKLLKNFDVPINLATGSLKTKQKNQNHITIGTHALLYEKEAYKNIGLVIIDEQHRFGVEQRAKLLEINQTGITPHLLSMTATPIPRTMALTLFGDLAISVLDAPPNTNKQITTTVVPKPQREKAYELVKAKNEQTFIVCPFIEESDNGLLANVKAAEVEYKKLKEGIFKNTPIGLLHGRMKPQEKQEVIKQFTEGKIKILVSTPVIEVGIDIPEATIMMIESAERYGLASLHQLRGRVGRGDKPGICLVFMSTDSPSSYKRLKNLETITNGLKLAEIDLAMRGQGDLYGTLQHGFKKFKLADINNIEMLEEAKHEAQVIYPNIDKHPKLLEKFKRVSDVLVGNN